MEAFINKSIKYVLPVAILAMTVVVAGYITRNPPEPLLEDTPARMPLVDATRLATASYPVIIRSQGTVQPALANTLVPAVDGTVSAISDNFVVGAAFNAGDILLQIDSRDYEIALTQAQATLAQSEAKMQEQQALAESAQAEWRALGRAGEPSALTLRVPQLAAARAERDAALAQVERARLDLERTRLVAPYDGIVSERRVDLGQFLPRGATVGSIHSIHAVEVRLPLTSKQQAFLRLPNAGTEFDKPRVELRASSGAAEQVWTGSLIRVEGIESSTQQLNVVARIDAPYARADQPLRVGRFVQALIAGQVLENVFVIPRSAVREANQVLIVDENNEVRRRQVRVAWFDEAVAVIDEGLAEGDLLVLTPMSTVADGTPVRVIVDGVMPASVDS